MTTGSIVSRTSPIELTNRRRSSHIRLSSINRALPSVGQSCLRLHSIMFIVLAVTGLLCACTIDTSPSSPTIFSFALASSGMDGEKEDGSVLDRYHHQQFTGSLSMDGLSDVPVQPQNLFDAIYGGGKTTGGGKEGQSTRRSVRRNGRFNQNPHDTHLKPSGSIRHQPADSVPPNNGSVDGSNNSNTPPDSSAPLKAASRKQSSASIRSKIGLRDTDYEEEEELMYNPISGMLARQHDMAHSHDTYGSIVAGINEYERARRVMATQDALEECKASCVNGQCSSDGICTCDEDGVNGYWSGTTCTECLDGYAGPECLKECNGGSCNQCTGNGLCSSGTTGDGSCTCYTDDTRGHWSGDVCQNCATGYYGTSCQYSCPGLSNGNGLVCYGRGDCLSGIWGTGVCTCQGGWGSGTGCFDCGPAHYSIGCTQTCVGYMSSGPYTGYPCSGHGRCNNGTAGDGTCTCDAQYGGRDCKTKCPTTTSEPCSGHGICNDGADKDGSCTCGDSYAPPDCSRCVASKTGSSCQLECHRNPVTEMICSGNGMCTYSVIAGQEIVSCECSPGYRGETCEFKCQGNPPCSSNGVCNTNFECECFADTTRGYWAGEMCDRCDVKYNSSTFCNVTCPTNSIDGTICSGQGVCMSGKCFCNRNDLLAQSYCGTACEIKSYERYETDVCIGCECYYCKTYISDECKRCGDDQQDQCSGNGICDYGKSEYATGLCTCADGFSGAKCDLACPIGTSIQEPCSGFSRGTCDYTYSTEGNAYAICKCREQYTGTSCEIDCPMVNALVCNERGTCNSLGKCDCIVGYTGASCSMQCGCDTTYGNCILDECVQFEGKQDSCTVCQCDQNFIGSCNACTPGYQGAACDGLCVNGTTSGKECICDEYFSYSNCSVYCPVGLGGQVCSGNGTCSWGQQFQGICQCYPASDPIYFGTACDVYCTPQMCQEKFGLLHPQCNTATGTCECQSTSAGMWARGTGLCDACQTGYWGQSCSETCDCNSKGSCDQTTGVCTCFSSLELGYYTGSQCASCQTGYIGVGCRRKSVTVTRLKFTTPTNQLLDDPPSGSIESAASVRTVLYDEDYQQLFIGSTPLAVYDIDNTTSALNLQRVSTSTDAQSIFACRVQSCNASDSTQCTNTTYNAEIAYTFHHQTISFYVTQPQKACGLGPQIFQLKRGSKSFESAGNPTREIDSEHTYINTTMRIVSITAQYFDFDDVLTVPPVYIYFIAAQQYLDSSATVQQYPGGVLVRVDVAALNQGVDAVLYYDFAPKNMIAKAVAVQQYTQGNPDFFAVGGSVDSLWDVYAFRVSTSTGLLIPAYAAEGSTAFSIKSRVPCWPSQSEEDEAECITADCYCRYCSQVTHLHFKDYSLSLTIATSTGVMQAWLQRLQDVTVGEEILVNVGSLCLTGTMQVASTISAGGDQRTVTPCASPSVCYDVEYHVLMAPSNLENSIATALTFDADASVTYVAVSMGSSESQLLKFALNKDSFGLYGLLLLEFQTNTAKKTVPEVITTFSIGRKTRFMYAGLGSLSRIIPLTFLLYEIQEFQPDLADNRGGTVITIVGNGFRKQLTSSSSIDYYNITCNFGNGQYLIPATFVSFTELTCVTPRYVDDLTSEESCDGQALEITLYEAKWYTDNEQTIQRVQPATLSSVTPDRGATTAETTVMLYGSQFVDSEFARCRFNSTNSTVAYYSKITFINSTAIQCTQPIAQDASVDRALIDLSHDGQLYTETAALDYQIVGAAAAILTDPPFPTALSMKAAALNRFGVRVYVVDEELHNLENLDTTARVVYLKTNIAMVPDDCTGDHRVQTDGFPWPPCREASINNFTNNVEFFNENISTSWMNRTEMIGGVLALRGTSDGSTVRGYIPFQDLYFLEPRKGTVNISFFTAGDGWVTTLKIEITEGDPYALTIATRVDFGESGTTANKFYINTDSALSVKEIKVIVVDSLGNIVKSALITQNYTVSAVAYHIFDGTTNRVIDNTTLVSPPKLEESYFVFNDVKMLYKHGMDHFLWFTATPNFAGVRPIKDFITPAIRTAICADTFDYKVPNSDVCESCPSAGAICNGTEIIRVVPGYWRGPNVTTSIYACTGGSTTCLGSLGAASGSTCAPEYEGTLCSICKQGFGKSGDTCIECGAFWWMLTSILLVAVVVFGAVVGWSIMSLRKAETTDMSVVLRTLMNHMQATGELGQFSKEFDPFVKGLFNIQATTTSFSIGGVQSLDCVLKEFGANYAAIFYAYMSIPLLAVVIGIVVTIVVRIMGLQPVITEKLRAEIMEDIRALGPHAKTAVILHSYPVYMVLITTLSVTLFTVYQMLITQSTNVLTCDRYVVGGTTDEPIVKYYLALDFSVECDSKGGHSFSTQALLFAIGYGFGIPLAFVCSHIYINSRIEKPELTKLMFLFLTGGYKEEFWFWQAIIMIRKMVLVSVLVFLTDGMLQSYAATWIMSISLVLQVWLNPAEKTEHNLVEAISLAIITATLNLSLLYFWKGLPDFGKTILTMILLVITIGAICMFAYFLFEPVKQQVFENLTMVIEIIRDFTQKKKREERAASREKRRLEREEKKQRKLEQAAARKRADELRNRNLVGVEGGANAGGAAADANNDDPTNLRDEVVDDYNLDAPELLDAATRRPQKLDKRTAALRQRSARGILDEEDDDPLFPNNDNNDVTTRNKNARKGRGSMAGGMVRPAFTLQELYNEDEANEIFDIAYGGVRSGSGRSGSEDGNFSPVEMDSRRGSNGVRTPRSPYNGGARRGAAATAQPPSDAHRQSADDSVSSVIARRNNSKRWNEGDDSPGDAEAQRRANLAFL